MRHHFREALTCPGYRDPLEKTILTYQTGEYHTCFKCQKKVFGKKNKNRSKRRVKSTIKAYLAEDAVSTSVMTWPH